MKQLTWNAIAVMSLLVLGGAVADAQSPGRTTRPTARSSSATTSRYSRPRIPAYNRPAISPYINLLGGTGRSFESEYFTRVRPQLEFRGSYNQLGRGLSSLQGQVQQQGRQIESMKPKIGPTGHSTSFLNYGSYFPKNR